MARTYNEKNTNFLSINADGLLYKKVTADTPNAVTIKTQDGKIFYHLLFNGGSEIGKLAYLGIREANFPSGVTKFLSIVIEGAKETDMISIPLFHIRGGLNGYIKSLACILPNLDFSRTISLRPSTKKDANGFVNKNIFINYEDNDNNEFVKLAHFFGEKGDIPPVETTKGIDGTEKTNFVKQDEYLYNVLSKEILRFQNFKNVEKNPPKTTEIDAPATKIMQPTPQINEKQNEYNDELPF